MFVGKTVESLPWLEKRLLGLLVRLRLLAFGKALRMYQTCFSIILAPMKTLIVSFVFAHKTLLCALAAVGLNSLITTLTKRANTETLIGLLRVVLEYVTPTQHLDSPEGALRLKFLRRSAAPGARPRPTLTERFRTRSVSGEIIVPTPYIKIAIVDFGNTGVNPADLPKVAAAIQRQVSEHFALCPPYGYGINALVRSCAPEEVLPNEWVCGLFETPDVARALGYHDQTPTGKPLMKVFPRLDAQDNARWSVTTSHEVLECLADPNLCKAAQAPDGRFCAYEIADACEASSYEIDGVKVSNFVLPPYFEQPKDYRNLKLDYLGLVHSPLEILDGGYSQFYDAASGGWQEVYSSRVRAARTLEGRGGRRERRKARVKLEPV